jgi:hypothetical protein
MRISSVRPSPSLNNHNPLITCVAYPPPDRDVRRFFQDLDQLDDDGQHVRLSCFLEAVFSVAQSGMENAIRGPHKADSLARTWYNIMKYPSLESVNSSRNTFLADVIKKTNDVCIFLTIFRH